MLEVEVVSHLMVATMTMEMVRMGMALVMTLVNLLMALAMALMFVEQSSQADEPWMSC